MFYVSNLNLTTAQNNRIKSDVCANRIYTNREEQKDAISEYLIRDLEDDVMIYIDDDTNIKILNFYLVLYSRTF